MLESIELDTEIIITTFKVAGAIIGGVLGVVGVLFNFKDQDGRITRWGVIVILGIALSAVVGIVTSITEGFKGRLEAAQQAARTEQLLTGLTRLMQPISDVEISFWVKLPPEAPLVRSYLKKLSKEVERRAPELKKIFPIDQNFHVTSEDRDGSWTITIGQKSKSWPSGDEFAIGQLARSFNFSLHLRKNPIDAEHFDSVIAVDDGRSDWIAGSLPLNPHNHLSYKPKTGDLEIGGHADYNKQFWHSNGKITSVEDLYGAQLFLIPPYSMHVEIDPSLPYSKNDITQTLEELSHLIVIEGVILTFGPGRQISIDGKAFKKSRYKYGYPAFSIILPNNAKAFESIRPRE